MEGGDKKAEVILVRTLAADVPELYNKDGIRCRRVRFNQVDLSEGKIKSNCFPPMLNWFCDGAMVRSDSGPVVYLIGGLSSRDELTCEPIDGASSDDVYYKCGCRMDLQKEEEGRVWEQIDLPIKNCYIPFCASLFGKLYEFGFRCLHTPEVFDPNGGVISDPQNSRFLVHLYDGTLYAFYPGSGEWERNGSLFHWRYRNVVLVDNVLYIHDFKSRGFLYAYDVARRQELKVTWSSKKYEYSNGYRVKVTKYEFDAMFYVGGGHFRMATWSPCDGDEGTTSSASTMFFKFKVDRPNNGLNVVCTPVDVQCHDIPNTIEVTGFLLL
ncbi:unnamed protein product [Cuscuta campestris]|uniref:DUF295 domain-containing protein n=1 Tax=Cuscuta campestris TaxID=132261 RepID=A0A484L4Y1_9ASTE|nr:unnamed protein product [Cuscuta campestris]